MIKNTQKIYHNIQYIFLNFNFIFKKNQSDGAGAAILVSEEFMKKHKLED